MSGSAQAHITTAGCGNYGYWRIWHVAHMFSKRLSPASESCSAYLLEHAAEFLGKEYGGLMPGAAGGLRFSRPVALTASRLSTMQE